MASKPQYGYQHQRDRELALANFVDRTPCPICLRPMRTWQNLDLNHTIPVAYGGGNGPKVLTHSYCNRAQGSSIRYSPRNRNRLPRNRNVTRRIEGNGNKEGDIARRNGNRQLPKW